MKLVDWFKKWKSKHATADINLHVAGATVLHKSSFDKLISYQNEVELSQAFIDEWVNPFYFELRNQSEEWIEKMIQLSPKISDDIILQNLGSFNWRMRSTGAYFAAIKNKVAFTDIIGIHLLKSEVCYAGTQYATTLASFNTPQATEYLNRYLNYYLQHPELDFDQVQVMSAIKYLDEINGTNFTEQQSPLWDTFCQSKIETINKRTQQIKYPINESIMKLTDERIQFWESDVSSKFVAESISVIDKIKE